MKVNSLTGGVNSRKEFDMSGITIPALAIASSQLKPGSTSEWIIVTRVYISWPSFPCVKIREVIADIKEFPKETDFLRESGNEEGFRITEPVPYIVIQGDKSSERFSVITHRLILTQMIDLNTIFPTLNYIR